MLFIRKVNVMFFLMTSRYTHKVSNMLSKPNFLIRNYFHLKSIKISSIEDPLKDEVVKILRASFTTVLLLEQCLTPLSYLSKSAVSHASFILLGLPRSHHFAVVVPVLLIIADELK